MKVPKTKTLMLKLLYTARDFRSKELFKSLKEYCHGDVLDVGGWDFFLTAKKRKINFKTWTTIENSNVDLNINDKNFCFIQCDGCNMEFESNKFDTVLNIQVLEHVFEPIKMVKEISRVLKPNGIGVFLIPQTSTIHLVPYHYYNFTRFWIIEVMGKAELEILELKPLGGIWSSMASHMFFFFLQSFRYKEMSTSDSKRNMLFYIFYPMMVLYVIISFPIVMFFSLGDLTEEPNNHLVVVRKK